MRLFSRKGKNARNMKIIEKLSDLIDVKSYMTICLITVYALLVYQGRPIPEPFQSVIMIIIGFFFGTQYQKADNRLSGKGN
jgi:RsiW-degrading membrane proteinase PrsW (M82 family)